MTSKIKLESVKMLGNGKFIINDNVFVHNMREENNSVYYDINYDGNLISETEAEELTNNFIITSIK